MSLEYAAVSVAVVPVDAQQLDRAHKLARQLSLSVAAPGEGGARVVLLVGEEGLSLQLTGPRAPGPVWADLAGAYAGARAAGLRQQPLGRALGLGRRRPGRDFQPPLVLDATAGLGRDAAAMVRLGCRVRAVERHPVVAALLRDGLRRASSHALAGPALSRGLSIIEGEAREVLGRSRPDIVYLDPMFPSGVRSAASKKEMQVLGLLLGEADDIETLLDAALAAARRRVVVKRPRRAPTLDRGRPPLRVPGRSLRFDVYLCNG